MDDKKIMLLLKQDEEQWYSALIDRYTPYVAAIISGIAKGSLPTGDIEEVSADVFFKIWCKREQIRSSSLKAFLAQIARNAAIDRLRVKGVEFVPLDDDILQVSYHGQPDDLAILRDQKQIVEDAVHSFGEPEREIFIRFYYFGETLKNISDRLHLNTATTKTKLYRLRAKLRDILRERGYGCEKGPY